MNTTTGNQSGFAVMWVFVVIAVLVVATGGYLLYANQQADEEEPETTQTQTTQEVEEEPEEEPLPADFTLFEDAQTDITFAYPASWGTAEMVQDDFSHDGESYHFTFSDNDEVRAGVKSQDFVYTDGPRGGFGAIGLGGQLFSEHVANIQSADSDFTEIIEQSDAHLLYAGVDMGFGTFVSLALELSTPSFSYIEFAYTSDELPSEGSDEIASHINPVYIEEFERIATVNNQL